MAVLLHATSGERVVLRGRHRVGRSRASDLRLDAAEVSGDHALFTWNRGWTLRDLGSRNGTFVQDRRIEPGQSVPLELDVCVGFGRASGPWRVVSLAPPSASARSGPSLVEGDEGLLALPDMDEPEVVLEHEAGRGWLRDGQPVCDGEQVAAGGRMWVLSLPELLQPTREVAGAAPTLEVCHLHFAVSPDEEFVRLSVEVGGQKHALPSRARHYVLLTLARARQQDREAGLSEAAAGWRHTEDVQRMLKATRNQIYVSVHRIKKDLKGLGVLDGERIVERHGASHQIRIGTGAFTLGTM